jgi:hypothetical protein
MPCGMKVERCRRAPTSPTSSRLRHEASAFMPHGMRVHAWWPPRDPRGHLAIRPMACSLTACVLGLSPYGKHPFAACPLAPPMRHEASSLGCFDSFPPSCTAMPVVMHAYAPRPRPHGMGQRRDAAWHALVRRMSSTRFPTAFAQRTHALQRCSMCPSVADARPSTRSPSPYPSSPPVLSVVTPVVDPLRPTSREVWRRAAPSPLPRRRAQSHAGSITNAQ